VPADVVQRAEAVLADEAEGRTTMATDDTAAVSDIPASTDGGELPADVLAELQSVDLAETTPLEALNLLSRLKSQVE
jgi:DNA mismatch repair protein MutS